MAKATDGVSRAPSPSHERLAHPHRWTLSPSDLTFLWEECRRCFYEKVALGARRPASPFPKLFGIIDRAMKDFYLGERAEAIATGAPTGVIGSPDRWVKSAPITLSACGTQVILRGRLDALVHCDDGSYGVVDFKTALPHDGHVSLYSRQLHAYAWALEQPASGLPSQVSSLGLLCFAPTCFEADGTDAALVGDVSWIDVPHDDAGFHALLGEVVALLETPEAPSPDPECRWCAAYGTQTAA